MMQPKFIILPTGPSVQPRYLPLVQIVVAVYLKSLKNIPRCYSLLVSKKPIQSLVKNLAFVVTVIRDRLCNYSSWLQEKVNTYEIEANIYYNCKCDSHTFDCVNNIQKIPLYDEFKHSLIYSKLLNSLANFLLIINFI